MLESDEQRLPGRDRRLLRSVEDSACWDWTSGCSGRLAVGADVWVDCRGWSCEGQRLLGHDRRLIRSGTGGAFQDVVGGSFSG